MKLSFHGGARSVTGANHLLDTGTVKILVDCGLFQGSRYSEELNYEKFQYDPAQIDYVLITHSHADHIGRLPKLYRDGFRGKIIATEPTQKIVAIALYDTLDKVVDEARSRGHEPMYRKDDVDEMLELFQGIQYRQTVSLGEGVEVIFHEASHILGSAILEVRVSEEGKVKRVVFTGDLGNPPTPLLNPIDYVPDADYLIIESAYGNRIHENRDIRRGLLEEVLIDSMQRGGVLMIPSFAVERTQELLLEFDQMFEAGKLPKVPIFLDSPLATKITHAYSASSAYFNASAVEILKDNQGLFQFPWLVFTPSVNDSKHINDVPAPKIIIAGSGMSQGGRILHHELRYLPHPENTILFVGYQVEGSLGRRILEGEKEVTVLGIKTPVRCRVVAIGAYSAHADQDGLLKCVEESNKAGNLKQVFIVQGEEDSALALAAKIEENYSIKALVPEIHQTVEL